MKKSENVFLTGSGRSIFLQYLDRFCKAVYGLFATGLLSRLMLGYSKESEALKKSTGYQALEKRTGDQQAKGVRQKVIKFIESSRIFSWMSSLAQSMVNTSLTVYGLFFGLFGLYTIATFMTSESFGIVPKIMNLYVGISMAAIAIPMLFVTMPLARILQSSRAADWVLNQLLGLAVDKHEKTPNYAVFVALILSLVCGFLTFWCEPLKLLAMLAVIIVSCVILAHPETGTIVAIVIAPILMLKGSTALALLYVIVLSVIGYTVKVARGRRVFRMELLDGAIAVFALLYLLSGIFTKGGVESVQETFVLVILFLAYFLCVNLMRTPEWLARVKRALLLPGIPVLVLFLFTLIYVKSGAEYLSADGFDFMYGFLLSVWNGRGSLVIYFAMLSILILPELIHSQKIPERLLYSVYLIASAATMFLYESSSVLIGWFFAVLLFLLIFSWRTLKYILVGILPGGTAVCYLHWLTKNSTSGIGLTFRRLFLWLAGTDEASVMMREYSAKVSTGVFRMLGQYWFSGIGVGYAAFTNVYPMYAEIGVEGASFASNLYLQILSEVGVTGLVVFAAVALLFIQYSFEYMRAVTDSALRSQIIGGICIVVSLLFIGAGTYVFASKFVFFLFWMFASYEVASIRCNQQEMRRVASVSGGTQNEADAIFVGGF